MTKEHLRSTDIVIFGGCGDLSLRKILPSLLYRLIDQQFPSEGRVILADRHIMSSEELHASLEQYCSNVSEGNRFYIQQFAERIISLPMELKDASAYKALFDLLHSTQVLQRIFYLATSSHLFPIIARHLSQQQLIEPHSRVVLEKPLGEDYASFIKLDQEILSYFNEQQIYRIDHYLGKETVQNLMIIRFANAVFAKIWDSNTIEHVQITVAETVGVEQRAEYYDRSGALRDMVQNHLMQLLCLIAMEPPSHIDPDSIRDEKMKVLKCLRAITPSTIHEHVVLGQYQQGNIDGKEYDAYSSFIGKKSQTETFAALKLYIDNWRWSGVPFYLRTGKRLATHYSEIVLQFRQVPHHLFPSVENEPETNKLIIRLQPDERITMQMITKVPGPGGYRLKPVDLNLSLADQFQEGFPEAYERLLMDIVRGNPTLFMRSDEVAIAWQWMDQLIKACQDSELVPYPYAAGTAGPKEADRLIERLGHRWHKELDTMITNENEESE